MKKFESVILLAIGSFIAGLLVAPKSGKETRKDIKDKAEVLKIKAKNGLREAKKGVNSIKDEVADGAEVVKNEVIDRSEAVKAKAEQTAEDIKNSNS